MSKPEAAGKRPMVEMVRRKKKEKKKKGGHEYNKKE